MRSVCRPSGDVVLREAAAEKIKIKFRCFRKFSVEVPSAVFLAKKRQLKRSGFKTFPDEDLRVFVNQGKVQAGFESTDRHTSLRLCALGKYIDANLPGLKTNLGENIL